MLSGKDSPGTRHAGGWIVLGIGMLAASAIGAAMRGSNSDASGRHGPRTLGQDLAGNQAFAEDGLAFPGFLIDINSAGAAELSAAPGVGPKLAQKIIDYRNTHGPFQSPQQLEQIPGVGRKLALMLGGSMFPSHTQSDLADASRRPADNAIHD